MNILRQLFTLLEALFSMSELVQPHHTRLIKVSILWEKWITLCMLTWIKFLTYFTFHIFGGGSNIRCTYRWWYIVFMSSINTLQHTEPRSSIHPYRHHTCTFLKQCINKLYRPATVNKFLDLKYVGQYTQAYLYIHTII